MRYVHVDVFSSEPLQGNGLAVVFPDQYLPVSTLQAVAREFNQFETIFVYPETETGFPVRIFTVDEELSFAGHPVLGAGAVIHDTVFAGRKEAVLNLLLGDRTVEVRSRATASSYSVTMNQGPAQFIADVPRSAWPEIAGYLNILPSDIVEGYPVEVVSTGLPYLLVPVGECLDRARIAVPGFESFLSRFGARFVYLFNPQTLECRTWDNAGLVEDVATGSAAGPLCAYLVKHGHRKSGEVIRIFQGNYARRPSKISGWISGASQEEEIFVEGSVAFFARGEVLSLSPPTYQSRDTVNRG